MRKFSYIKDYNIIGTTINGYIIQLEKEIKLLNDMNPDDVYEKAINVLEEFKTRYANLHYVSSLILKDLLEPNNVEYYYKYGKYPFDASKLGMELENDLKKIFVIEDELKVLAIESWKSRLTSFDSIVNGEDFMVVGHASSTLPGTKNFKNYKSGKYTCQYLSCSLLSSVEFNTFNKIKTVFVTDVDEDNYISSSSYDSVTSDNNSSSFETLKEINDGVSIHYIKVGHTFSIDRAVTTVSTPDLIEKMSVDRELKENGEMYNYEKSLTNEIVLDRTTTNVTGALLISNGCDLLINEYLFLKKNNVKFKCLNKGLYKEKHGLKAYNENEYECFLKLITSLSESIKMGRYTNDDLLSYYNEVVIPMKYSPEIMNIIKENLLGSLEFDDKTGFKI